MPVCPDCGNTRFFEYTERRRVVRDHDDDGSVLHAVTFDDSPAANAHDISSRCALCGAEAMHVAPDGSLERWGVRDSMPALTGGDDVADEALDVELWSPTRVSARDVFNGDLAAVADVEGEARLRAAVDDEVRDSE